MTEEDQFFSAKEENIGFRTAHGAQDKAEFSKIYMNAQVANQSQTLKGGQGQVLGFEEEKAGPIKIHIDLDASSEMGQKKLALE